MSWEIKPQWEALLGLLGTVAAVALFLSPLKTFQRIIINKNTEEFPSFPYVSTFLNCAVWIFYCLPFITPGRTSPLVTNFIGVAIQTGYLAIFYKNAHEKARILLQRQMAITVVFLFVLVAIVLGVLAPSHRSPFVGFVATVFNVIMFAAPLSALSIVLRTRSVEFMPLPLSVMALACSATWTVYGVYVRDSFVIVPNALGMVLGVVQLVIYYRISAESGKKGSYELVKGNGGEPASTELTSKA